ncbi:MAG: GGDEF domain-containing protein [Clostridia bacterium]|nr:GGDEF domain-containing protein [Clostridia bacterium]
MLYSIAGTWALIINLILNWRTLRDADFFNRKKDRKNRCESRYSYFLLAASCYFISDLSWGILYENHIMPEFHQILYALTVVYFVLMLLTMLTWIRYGVAYINMAGRGGRVLVHAAWAIFVLGIIFVILNVFNNYIFSFNSAYEYVAESGRYPAFALQIGFHVIVSVYMLFATYKVAGRQKLRCFAVALASIVLCAFLVIQIAFAMFPSYSMGLIIAICVIHSFVEAGELKEREIHEHISTVMAEAYEAIYYVEISTGEFLTFSKGSNYNSGDFPSAGADFFRTAMENIEKNVYPDDRAYAESICSREFILDNLKGRNSFAFRYRIIIGGEPRSCSFTVMLDNNGKYFVIFVRDIEEELLEEKKQKENRKLQVTFGQIAESLASNYDEIYYVDAENSSYVRYQVNNIFGQLEISQSGDDFFGECMVNIPKIIQRQDRDKVSDFIRLENLTEVLENYKSGSIDYRIVVSGETKYVRLTARKTSDGTHFIIGVENVDEEIEREKRHIKALRSEHELARKDELTGVKNNTAFKELMDAVQDNIDKGLDYLPFALVVCDTNDLKKINDTLGHVAGDEYIKASAQILCDLFVHSPVFRIGGDEFVVFLRGSDYTAREELMHSLREQILENQKSGIGPILASGMAEYEYENDNDVTEIFDRADREMYANKKSLKEGKH